MRSSKLSGSRQSGAPTEHAIGRADRQGRAGGVSWFQHKQPQSKMGSLTRFYRPTSPGGARIGLGEWGVAGSCEPNLDDPSRTSPTLPLHVVSTPFPKMCATALPKMRVTELPRSPPTPQKLQFRPLAPPRGRPISCQDFRKCAFRHGRPTPIRPGTASPGPA